MHPPLEVDRPITATASCWSASSCADSGATSSSADADVEEVVRSDFALIDSALARPHLYIPAGHSLERYVKSVQFMRKFSLETSREYPGSAVMRRVKLADLTIEAVRLNLKKNV